jgi:subtilisin family serine protease
VTLVLVLAGMSFGLISPSLQEHLTKAQADQKLPVHVVLKEQFDKELLNSLVDGMPRAQRRVEVARILKGFSAGRQAGVLEYLATTNAENVQSLWVVNAVYCEATPAVIQALSARPEVNYVNYDWGSCPDQPEPAQDGGGSEEIAWGVDKINAPAAWALGYRGQGIVCGHIDSGCNYNHPDLADHMWTDPNYPHHGWNFEYDNDDPMDQNSHGTHTAGTVAGDGTGGTQTGVAPDAQIMICRVSGGIDSIAESQVWAAMQFVVSPPLSPSHGADLYTMSLGLQMSWAPHQSTWRTTADNVNAAGVSQIVAAGNERGMSPPNACRCPGNVPPPWWNPQNTGTGTLSGVVSIGATTESDTIASFSSPGPVTWSSVAPFSDYAYPPGLTRPDVSAPGTNIKSCYYTGVGYTNMDGTSMATPHVAGAVCLMLSKNPNLTPYEVDSILELTAVDRGAAGKDNDFGAGRINALAAVEYVTGGGGPVLKLASTQVIDSTGNNNGRLDQGETVKLLATLRNFGGATCRNVTGTFRAYDARLTVTDSTGTWGDIGSGASVTNTSDPFELHADTSIRSGTTFTCSLFISGDSAVLYSAKMQVKLVVGMPWGGILWGPKPCPNMPADGGLYGLAYNTRDDLIYCVNIRQMSIYKYSSDSMLTDEGTISAPNDSCTDIDYIAHANALWVVASPQKMLYKITPGGSLIAQYLLTSYASRPIGVTEDEVEHTVFISDRQTTPSAQQLIYVADTLGHRQYPITHPLQGPYGTRCLALDGRCPANPPSLLNIWAFYNAGGGTRDSSGMLEMDRLGSTVLSRYVFPNKAWDVRGIECDPRDGSYWVTIGTGGSTDNQIVKVAGFSYGRVGVEEREPWLPGVPGRLDVQAQPNPFTGRTDFSVQLPAAGSIDLRVFDNSGRVVRTFAGGSAVTAQARITWDGRNDDGQTVAPGVYFYRVTSATAQAWGKVILSR